MDAKIRPPLNTLSVSEIANEIAAGKTTCEAVVNDCVARIAERDGAVKAFVNFDAAVALDQARALDRGRRRGPLHGVPIGLKDTIDTFDMPTEMGSPIYRGNRPRADASCVALLRRAGAIIFGKTATCEFAGSAPPATTNPHNPAHTPGGSSSGSAAAVADFMVPAALGTQTGGSVLRPSSFCGVFGYKPTYNTINKQGVWPAADSIDTIGWLGRSVDDVALLTTVLRMETPRPPRELDTAPRIGVWRTDLWDTAQDETKAAIEDAAGRLSKAGAAVRDIEMPDAFNGLHVIARSTIGFYERAACMAYAWDHQRERLSPQMQRYIENGHKISRDDYVAGLRRLDECRVLLGEVFASFDVLLVPCVPGEAPKGSRRHRRSLDAGDLDRFAHADHDVADPSRPQRSAGRHPAGGATLRRRSAIRLRALDLGQDRRAGDGRRAPESLMEFDNTFDVPLPPAQAWALLMDIPRIAPCMPGAELTEIVDPQNYKGKIAVRLGPVALTFAGRVEFDQIDTTSHTARVKAQGSDAKGRGGANATAAFRIEPAGSGSTVRIHTELMLSGAVAQYGRGVGMIEATAAQIVGQFATNLCAQLAETPPMLEGALRPASSEIQPPAAKPISGLSLMARVIWSRLMALFSGSKT